MAFCVCVAMWVRAIKLFWKFSFPSFQWHTWLNLFTISILRFNYLESFVLCALCSVHSTQFSSKKKKSLCSSPFSYEIPSSLFNEQCFQIFSTNSYIVSYSAETQTPKFHSSHKIVLIENRICRTTYHIQRRKWMNHTIHAFTTIWSS